MPLNGAEVTVTVNVPVAVLFDPSVAEQVTVVTPTAKVEPDGGVQAGGITPSTASNADTVKVTIAPLPDVATLVMFPGSVSTGGVVSGATTIGVAMNRRNSPRQYPAPA